MFRSWNFVLLACSLVCLLSTRCLADTEEFYVDPVNGSDSNDGSSGDPFLSISKALDSISTDTDKLIINLKPGEYSGPNNIALSYSIETFLQFDGSSDDSPASFICTNVETAFVVANSFSLNGEVDSEQKIQVSNCFNAIKSTNPVPQIQVLNVNFYSNNIGISSTDLTTLNVRDSGFYLGTNLAIQADGNLANGTSTFELDNVFFNTTGITVTDFNFGILDQVWFLSINGTPAFSALGGLWNIDQVIVQNLIGASAFNLDGTNQAVANFSITGSQFLDCNSGTVDGAGIHATSANVALTNTYFQDCTTQGRGGGYYHYNSTASSMAEVSFTNCSADFGGGMDLEGFIGDLELQNLVFTSNQAASNGSCISCCSELLGCVINIFDVENTISGSNNLDSAGAINVTCAIVEDSYFTEAVSSQQVSSVPTLQANNAIPWWVWLLVALVVLCLMVSVTSGIIYIIYQKRKERYTAIED